MIVVAVGTPINGHLRMYVWVSVCVGECGGWVKEMKEKKGSAREWVDRKDRKAVEMERKEKEEESSYLFTLVLTSSQGFRREKE